MAGASGHPMPERSGERVESPPGVTLSVAGLRLAVRGRTLVDDLSFEACPGELWALVGPNGVGKSTLLAALAGLDARGEDAIRLGGRPLAQSSTLERARIRAFLPQFVTDAFASTVLDSVLIGRHPWHDRWHWEDDADVRLARRALASVDLADCAERDVLSLSGGERRRAQLAAVLVQDAPLMLLDEPLAHLDLHHEHRVMRLLRGLAQDGRTLVVALHDVNLAARYATHALVFLGGGRVEPGPASEVLDAQRLSAAFRHPIARIAEHGVFVAR
jgi:iron complex transport system ATP-binding protein